MPNNTWIKPYFTWTNYILIASLNQKKVGPHTSQLSSRKDFFKKSSTLTFKCLRCQTGRARAAGKRSIHFQWHPPPSRCSDWRWVQLSSLISAAHVTLRPLTTSSGDPRAQRTAQLNVAQPGFVSGLGMNAPGVENWKSFDKASDLRHQRLTA